MKRIKSLIQAFFDIDSSTDVLFKERFLGLELERKVKHHELKIPKDKELLARCQAFPPRDQVIIKIEGVPVAFSCNNNQQPNQFLEECAKYKKAVEATGGGEFYLKITINKSIDEKKQLTVYSFSELVKFLEDQPFKGLLQEFNKLLKNNEYINFVFSDKMEPFYTSTFGFSPENSMVAVDLKNKKKRDDLIQKRDEICHFSNAGDYVFIPEDFFLVKRLPDNLFNSLFDKLSIIFSLIYLANITSLIGENRLDCKLDGYKRIEHEIDFGNLKNLKFSTCQEYFDIYQWVYSGGNLSDKIGLARNIISLHVRNKDLFTLEKGTLNSIKSSHELYLKKNVQQYIEVKNKISEFLCDMSQKSSEIADSFIGTFKNNITAFISFFISVMVLNALSGGKLSNIFTRDITLISLGLLGVSVLFLIVSIIEVSAKRKRFSDNYERLKNRYNSILDENDLKRIFNDDNDHWKDNKFIKKQTLRYSILWGATILIFSLVIFILGDL
ncbi:MAG: hypothetical protein JSV88_27600 [Candidatus Aminicenantes bacterium]|nr:MAG: hypothetical protein JSV88_27600 [Candidatus Aminicenantes bacterium]